MFNLEMDSPHQHLFPSCPVGGLLVLMMRVSVCVLPVHSPGRVQLIVLSPCDQLWVNPDMFQHGLRDKDRQRDRHTGV